ncbi:PIF1-like protein [Mya arenaria]|uniref:ATP-dependent DNA helicase n=1 Tax=Mya arenaria TaxID=6604 RepID=A0ABY7EZA6_MYAAR|nr:PIF1-like protein [Mya arenaria]
MSLKLKENVVERTLRLKDSIVLTFEGRQYAKNKQTICETEASSRQIKKTDTDTYSDVRGHPSTSATSPEGKRQRLECIASSSVNQNAQSLPYSCETFLRLIADESNEIPDDIVVASLNLMNALSTVNSKMCVGLYSPAQLHLASVDKSIVLPPPPLDKDILNIHPLTRHWVCTFYKADTRQLYIYDSLQSNDHIRDVKHQLACVYPQRIISSLKNVNVSQQGTNPMCGVMAIAFAFTCFLGLDPAAVQYDLTKARCHLKHCLSTAQVLPFPVKENTENMQWLQKYLADQLQYKLSATALRKRRSRQNKDVHEREQLAQRLHKQMARSDSNKHEKLKQTDNQSKRKARADPHKCVKLKQTDSQSKRKARVDPDKLEKAVEQFRKKISQKPIYICCVCNRLIFRQQVKCCDIHKFPKAELILRCIYANNMHKPQTECTKDCSDCPKWICFTCNNNLVKNKIPNQASLNHLNLDQQPDCLKKIEYFGKTLIIPFMKIVSLPKGSLKGIHGPVVCVPSNISTTVQTLPREFSDNTIIAVKLKRKLQYKGHHLYQQVSVNRVHEALLYLKQNSPHFSDQSTGDTSQMQQSSQPGIHIDLSNVTSTTEPTLTLPDDPVTCTDQISGDTSQMQQSSQPDSDDCSEDIHETSAPMVSCLEPEDLTQTLGPEEIPDSVFCVAPGQGSIPVTVFNMESKAFPYLFPTGRNTYNQDRAIKLGLNRYFNNRLFNADLRFASDPQFIFYSQYISELNIINNSVSIAMRKACRMFQNRVLAFITELILSPAQPIGQVSDFFYRTEFQSRGWPHIHCLFWCSDAPSFDLNTGSNQDFVRYIDKYITCSLPDKETDPELFEIVTSVQMHSKRHSRSCKKGSKPCRFNFPRPVSSSTFIAVPKDAPESVPPATYKKAAIDTLSAVYDMINTSQEEDTETTVSDIFESLNITQDMYQAAHCAIAKKNTVIYKRNIPECWINPYNSDLLRAWNGNMDIQPVLDAYSCIMYIVSYISKAERELGDLLRNAQKEAKEGHLQPVQQLRKLGNVYLNSREVSVMEAVYRVTGMHLKQSSRQVVFIPVDRHSAKISKPLKWLKEEDENIWMTTLIDRYLARPASPDFEQLCLAEFARDYSVKDRSNPDTDDHTDHSANTDHSNVYKLQNNMGTIMKRKKAAVIRYMKVNKNKNSEDYYHNMLRLYLPHRTKDFKPINCETYEQMFHQLSDTVLPLISQFEKLSQDLDEAWRSLQEHGYPDDAWADLAPNQEPSRRELDEELRNAMELFTGNAQEIPQEDIPDFYPNQTTTAMIHHSDSQHTPSCSRMEQTNRLRNMNYHQAQIFHFIKTWAHIKERGDSVKQFYIFLTGGAGTGKSFTIKTIYHELNRILTRASGNPDLPVALLVSYTGTAAFNINGQTIHSAFSINRGMSKVLPEDSANTLRSNLQDLQVLIIDEVSMVPIDLLNLIHCRLQQVKQPFAPSAYFGNVSILAVGDFYQIPPVAKKSLLSNNTSLTDLWSLFHIWELTEVVRQKGDQEFIALLNRLRVRRKHEALTTDDETFLRSCIVSKNDPSYPRDKLHIAPLHRQLNEHNEFMLTQMSETHTMYNLQAADMCHDSKTEKTFKRNQPLDLKDTSLPANLTICCGARVMLTMNINVSDGFTNGAMGTVTSVIARKMPLGLPDAICVLFQEESVGLQSRNSLKPPHEHSSSTVIVPQTEIIQRRPFQVTRHQYPLMLAWAVTTHKIQGATADSAVVSLDGAFKPGMAYVALSRVTSSSGLHLLQDHFNTDVIYCDHTIEDKLRNIPRANMLENWNTLMPKTNIDHSGCIYIASHNCEGLIPHLQDVNSSLFLKHMDIIALQETWLKQQIQFTNPFPLHRQFLSYRQYRPNHEGVYAKGGVALYIHQDFTSTLIDTTATSIECVAVELSDISTSVYCVYRPPNTSCKHFATQLSNLLHRSPTPRTIIVGDFNLDLYQATDSDLNMCFQEYSQIIQQPTTAGRTLLDHMYIKNINCKESGVIPTHYSYHDMTFAVFANPNLEHLQ